MRAEWSMKSPRVAAWRTAHVSTFAPPHRSKKNGAQSSCVISLAPLSLRQSGVDSAPSLFAGFCAFYVTGLWQTIEAFGGRNGTLRGILYPSSVALEELPLHMGEYSMAKAAGETLCALAANVAQETLCKLSCTCV
jgi:hypothetical protein